MEEAECLLNSLEKTRSTIIAGSHHVADTVGQWDRQSGLLLDPLPSHNCEKTDQLGHRSGQVSDSPGVLDSSTGKLNDDDDDDSLQLARRGLDKFNDQAMRRAWQRYKEFEEFSNCEEQSLSLVEFMAEWEARMKVALAAGLQYSDTVLAYKLLDRANLAHHQLELVFSSVDYFVGRQAPYFLMWGIFCDIIFSFWDPLLG